MSFFFFYLNTNLKLVHVQIRFVSKTNPEKVTEAYNAIVPRSKISLPPWDSCWRYVPLTWVYNWNGEMRYVPLKDWKTFDDVTNETPRGLRRHILSWAALLCHFIQSHRWSTMIYSLYSLTTKNKTETRDVVLKSS